MNTSKSKPSANIQALQKKHGSIRFGILGASSYENSEKMTSLLREWEPAGTSYEDLLFLFGPPNERKEGKEGSRLGYRIDSGLTGTMYYFHLENGHVLWWQTVPID